MNRQRTTWFVDTHEWLCYGIAVEPSFSCPVEYALDQLGGKWTPVILSRLKVEPMRYGELRRAISNLSDKMLTQRLKDLEHAGFVERKVESGRTTYHLTEDARSLEPVLQSLYDWGSERATQAGIRFPD